MEPVSSLVHQLEMLCTQDLNDNVEYSKQRLKVHPLHHAMFSLLIAEKEKHGVRMPLEDEKDPQVARLDNMLQAEGVTGPERESPPSAFSQTVEQDDYKVQLHMIRHNFQTTIAVREQESSTFIEQAKQVLRAQSALRPLSEMDVERVVGRIRRKLAQCQIAYKQETCEIIMGLKSKFCDARRKRRNFSKQATQILNDYFEKNIHSPYPTEDVKEQLARQCNISIAQVSNWFGNKRIRYKKNVAKANEDKEINDAKRTAEHNAMAMQAAAAQMMQMPMPFLDPSQMGSAPFPMYFPPYDPAMMNPHPPQ